MAKLSDAEKAIIRVRNAIGAYSYKPGWYFNVRINDPDEYNIHIELIAPAKDVKTMKRTSLTLGEIIPVEYLADQGMANREMAYHVPKMVQTLEMHESKEWLTHKGKLMDNPHPENKRYKGRGAYPENHKPMLFQPRKKK